MTPAGRSILVQLELVENERVARSGDAGLARRVQAVKAYQQERFRRGYRDLLADARYGAATQFFLDELYGPHDFSERDRQFARIVPALVRLFPEEIVETVDVLARLHALSERLDSTMARQLHDDTITAAAYVRAWQTTGSAADRRAQVDLVLAVGRALDRYTRNPLLRHSLRLMRAPAKAAGLAALQSFLERGFDTFRAMRGAEAFLGEVERREEALRLRLFDGEAVSMATDRRGLEAAAHDPLGQLP